VESETAVIMRRLFLSLLKLFFTLSILLIILLCYVTTVFAQNTTDSVGHNYSFHLQATLIPQYHFDFNAAYSEINSLLTHEPVRTSFTTTLYLVYKPFKHDYLVFNPEMTAGKGLSQTLGLAGFSNGEIYRVGDPNLHPYIARLYVEHQFPLSNRKENIEDDMNQLKETKQQDYVSILVGKFSLGDFFDMSGICNDPRTQFLNWSLMGSGAWDYPANTRGYTMGAVVQLIDKDYNLRGALTTVPIEANGSELQFKWNKAMGMVIELKKNKLFYLTDKIYSDFTVGFYTNIARMGNYKLAIENAAPIFMYPDITSTRQYGRRKQGWYIDMDNNYSKIHHYLNYSRNDGKNETWAFTEIDRSFTTGLRFDGDLWRRKKDNFGIGLAINGLSDDHKNYLAAGGYGFIIGDGRLNYGHEQIWEAYYSMNIANRLFISPDYQFIKNPAYNKDRGPVHIVSVRLHVEL